MKAIALALALLPALAWAQEQPPQGEGRWGFLVTQVAFIAPPPQAPINWRHDTGASHLLLLTFPSLEACNEARNLQVTPAQFSVPLGTGGAAQAHIGRSVTPCFKQ